MQTSALRSAATRVAARPTNSLLYSRVNLRTQQQAKAQWSRSMAMEATSGGKPFGNAPLWLSLVGFAGAGYYIYDLNKTPSTAKAAPPVDLKPALNKDEFVEFPLKKKATYNHNTTTYTFALPEGTSAQLPTASCVLIKGGEGGPQDDKGNPVVRPYTPVADRAGEIEFVIKKYDTGKMTPYLESLKEGDKISIKGPLPKIPYKPNEFDQIGMLAGGSGITPMYQVLTHALSQKDDKTKFSLIFSNVSPADILLKDEFEKLRKEHSDRFELIFVVDKPDDKWTGYTGYITPELIKDHFKGPEENVKVYVCGPPPQVKAIAGPKKGMKQGELSGMLKELGYTEEKVFKF